MAPLHLFVLGAALLGRVFAQSDGDSSKAQKVWASVVFVNHGETTPWLGPLDTILTPEGAHQLYRQGTAFRNRYLSVNNKEPGSDAAPIRDISQGAIDNVEITAVSQSEEWVVAGATAFFQGLYPASKTFNTEAGGMDVARNYLTGTDNLTDYPLDGYQYAQIQTFSTLDPQYPALQATVDCQARSAEFATQLRDSDDMIKSYRDNYDFYQDLFKSGPLEGLLHLDRADYWNSYEINELVKYMYKHNNTVFTQLENANETLARLAANALELETILTTTPDGADDTTDVLYTIAGRTLAAKVQQQLMQHIVNNGDINKLTVMFGSHVPLMSFFHVARLGSEESSNNTFTQFPEPGAAMMFELIGPSDIDSMGLPGREDLRVRFMYRATADEDEEFKAAALFGSSGAEQGLPWSDFSRQMLSLGVDSYQWCGVCQPNHAAWCSTQSGDGSTETESSSSKKGGLSPAVAGVIGAVTTLAVTALLGLALFFICGLRLRRREKDDSTVTGGFKGDERMPDDKDVAVSKGGARHERVGSWELRDGAGTPPAFNGAGIVTSDFNRRDEMVDDDGISVTGARVVNTRESV